MKEFYLYESINDIKDEILRLRELEEDLYATLKKTILIDDIPVGEETLNSIVDGNSYVINDISTKILPNINKNI